MLLHLALNSLWSEGSSWTSDSPRLPVCCHGWNTGHYPSQPNILPTELHCQVLSHYFRETKDKYQWPQQKVPPHAAAATLPIAQGQRSRCARTCHLNFRSSLQESAHPVPHHAAVKPGIELL